MSKRHVVLSCMVAVTLPLAAEPLSLEGYTIGQKMAKCSRTPKRVDTTTKPGTTLCVYEPTTLLGVPATALTLGLVDGKVAFVEVTLRDRGCRANRDIDSALRDRWKSIGPRTVYTHRNAQAWFHDDVGLLFDGGSGRVFLIDERSFDDHDKKGRRSGGNC